MDIPIITPLFGFVFKFLYGISQNYLLTLFLFAVIMKVVLLPFGIKQQKNSIRQAKLRPKEMAIRNKYKGRNDKATQQKMQEEIMKLYQEESFNPMSGCLPMLIQLPILFALYAVIINPLTHVASFDKTAINNIKASVDTVNTMLNVEECDELKNLIVTTNRQDQIGIINTATGLDGKDAVVFVSEDGKTIVAYAKGDKYYDTKNNEVVIENGLLKYANEVSSNVDEEGAATHEVMAEDPAETEETGAPADDNSSITDKSEEQEEVEKVEGIKVTEMTVSELFHKTLEDKNGNDKKFDSKKTISEIHSIKKSFNVFGLDLTETGRIDLSVYVLIPLLTFLFSFFSTKVIRKFTYQPQMAANADSSQKTSMGMMDWMMPLLSVWISLSISSAIAIYWMFQNVLSAVQQIVLFKLYPIPPVTEEMIKEAELQLKGKNKKNKQVVLSDDDIDDYDKTEVADRSSNDRKKSGIISSRKMNKINPKVKEIYKQGRHLTAKKKI